MRPVFSVSINEIFNIKGVSQPAFAGLMNCAACKHSDLETLYYFLARTVLLLTNKAITTFFYFLTFHKNQASMT